MHLLTFTSLALLLSIAHSEPFDQSRPAALIFRITREGLDTMTQYGSLALPKMMQSISMPDVNLPEISYMKVAFTNMAIKNFTDPKITYKLAPPNKITFDVTTGPIDFTANWTAEKPTIFFTQRDKGMMIFHMDSFTSSLTAEVGSDQHPNGLPAVAIPSCSATMGKASIIVKDNSQKFFIDMIQTVSMVFRRVVQSQLCTQIQKMVSSMANEKIQAVPDILTCNHGVGARYYVQPKVDDNGVEVQVKTQVVQNVPIVGEATRSPDIGGVMAKVPTTAPLVQFNPADAPEPAKSSGWWPFG